MHASDLAKKTRRLFHRWYEIQKSKLLGVPYPDEPAGDWDTLRNHPEATDEKMGPITMNPKYLTVEFFAPLVITSREQCDHYAEIICALTGAARKEGMAPCVKNYVDLLTALIEAYEADLPAYEG